MFTPSDWLHYDKATISEENVLIMEFKEEDINKIYTDIIYNTKLWWLASVEFKAEEMRYYAFYIEYSE